MTQKAPCHLTPASLSRLLDHKRHSSFPHSTSVGSTESSMNVHGFVDAVYSFWNIPSPVLYQANFSLWRKIWASFSAWSYLASFSSLPISALPLPLPLWQYTAWHLFLCAWAHTHTNTHAHTHSGTTRETEALEVGGRRDDSSPLSLTCTPLRQKGTGNGRSWGRTGGFAFQNRSKFQNHGHFWENWDCRHLFFWQIWFRKLASRIWWFWATNEVVANWRSKYVYPSWGI